MLDLDPVIVTKSWSQCNPETFFFFFQPPMVKLRQPLKHIDHHEKKKVIKVCWTSEMKRYKSFIESKVQKRWLQTDDNVSLNNYNVKLLITADIFNNKPRKYPELDHTT